ncbi:MAG: transcription elongation factor NusA [Thermoprotei archaeon ex4572_64]|nr:MAG: transcription elongation factor NusA [Thermoprotei archaeon ex4572_64]
MKIPFCTFCVKTRILCSRCQALLDSGEYDENDLEVINAFLNVASSGKLEEYLKGVEYVKSYSIDNFLVITLRGIKNLPRTLITQIEKNLEQVLDKKVRIVEKTGSINEIAMQLASPARILTIAISWLPDGTNEMIVKITKSEARKLPFKLSDFAKMLTLITGSNTKVEITR